MLSVFFLLSCSRLLCQDKIKTMLKGRIFAAQTCRPSAGSGRGRRTRPFTEVKVTIQARKYSQVQCVQVQVMHSKCYFCYIFAPRCFNVYITLTVTVADRLPADYISYRQSVKTEDV